MASKKGKKNFFNAGKQKSGSVKMALVVLNVDKGFCRLKRIAMVILFHAVWMCKMFRKKSCKRQILVGLAFGIQKNATLLLHFNLL